nr:hypothetical protein [Nitrosomonas nitrosa]
MPSIPEIQTRLRAAFPQPTDLNLARAAREGVLLADDLYADGSFLNNAVGRDLRGHVRRVGIAYKIAESCKRGDLPFTAELKAMPKGHWHWLELRATGALAHMCRTEDVSSFPDEAESRQDVRLSIQPDLLSWFARDKSLAEIVSKVPELYAWLTYRVNEEGMFSHLCWASPAPDCDDWLAHISILKEIAKAETDAAATVPPAPSAKDRLRFKDHIQQGLDQINDNKASGK